MPVAITSDRPDRPTRLPARRRFGAGPGLALAALVSLMLSQGCAGDEARPDPPVRAIKWTEVRQEHGDAERRLSGVVRPVDHSQLSFEVAGRIERIRADIGDRVREGDMLAELDRQPFELALRKAEAGLKEAEAHRWRERAEFERFEALYAASAVSRAELDQARASHESARSRLRAARAELGLAQRDLRNATLTAPFQGVISLKNVDRFMEVAAGAPIFELDSEDRFEVAVGVPDSLIDRVERGATVTIQLSRLGESLEGVITQVGSRSLSANTFPVKVRITERVEGLRAGMSAEVAFAMPAAHLGSASDVDSFVVPLAALSAVDDGHVVFVFDREASVVVRTPVDVLDLRAHRVEISGHGLSDGAVVATAGVEFLSDRQLVKLMSIGADRS